MGLSRTYRLRKKREFLETYATGKKFHTPYFLLYIKPEKSETFTRFGFTVSKKIGNAVRRNRVKRVFREVARKSLPLIESQLMIIIVAKKKSADATVAQIQENIDRCFQKARIIL